MSKLVVETIENTSGVALFNETILTPVDTTSGTANGFTGIPSGVKKMVFCLVGVSTNGTSHITLQIGDSGGIETSGYIGTSTSASNDWTSGAILASASAASVYEGAIYLDLVDASTNTWAISVQMGYSAGAATSYHEGAGHKSLSAELDRVSLTTLNGTDTFDAGAIKGKYGF